MVAPSNRPASTVTDRRTRAADRGHRPATLSPRGRGTHPPVDRSPITGAGVPAGCYALPGLPGGFPTVPDPTHRRRGGDAVTAPLGLGGHWPAPDGTSSPASCPGTGMSASSMPAGPRPRLRARRLGAGTSPSRSPTCSTFCMGRAGGAGARGPEVPAPPRRDQRARPSGPRPVSEGGSAPLAYHVARDEQRGRGVVAGAVVLEQGPDDGAGLGRDAGRAAGGLHMAAVGLSPFPAGTGEVRGARWPAVGPRLGLPHPRSSWRHRGSRSSTGCGLHRAAGRGRPPPDYRCPGRRRLTP